MVLPKNFVYSRGIVKSHNKIYKIPRGSSSVQVNRHDNFRENKHDFHFVFTRAFLSCLREPSEYDCELHSEWFTDSKAEGRNKR